MLANKNYFNYLFYGFFLLAAWVLIEGVYFSRDASFGDVAVFETNFSFYNNGHALYKETWDHKDFGYYFFGRYIYNFFGLAGLQFFTLTQLIVILILFCFAARKFSSVKLALVVVLFFSSVVVGSGLYMSPAPDLWAVNFLLLGLLLHRFSPGFSGVLLAVAVSMKISTFVSVGFIFGSYAYLLYLRKTYCLKDLIRSMLFFLATLLTIILVAYFEGSFDGWLEITRFNLFYSNISRGFQFDLINPIHQVTALIMVIFGWFRYAGFYLPVMTALIFVMTVVMLIKRKSIDELKLAIASDLILSLMALIFGSMLILMTQAPPSDTHYILIFMPIALIGSVQFIILTSNLKSFVTIKSLLLIAMIAIALIDDDVVFPKGSLNSYEGKGSIEKELELLPAGSTFAVFDANHKGLLKTSRFGAKLICRHHYILDHVYEFYMDEINQCIHKEPDYIFLNEIQLKSSMRRSFERINLLLLGIKSKYNFCYENDFGLSVYSFKVGNCKYLEN